MCHLFETFFNLLFLVSFSASVKVNLLLRLVFVIQIICCCLTRPKVFSFEKNSGGKNPPGPLSFITLNTKTEEELPARLVFYFQLPKLSLVFLWKCRTLSDGRFVFCWSHFQGKWDHVGPFHIYGSTGEPWFTARTWYWAEKGTIDLWGYFLTARCLKGTTFNLL